jgi:hypothetical protein
MLVALVTLRSRGGSKCGTRAARTSSELCEKEFLSNLREKRFAATKGTRRRHNRYVNIIWYSYVMKKSLRWNVEFRSGMRHEG